MAFGGGGGGAITAHVHDNTPLQGGPLDMAGTTIGSMAQGSVTYSDGAALQELVIGGSGTALTSNGTLPIWGAAAGGSCVYQETFEIAGADSATWNITPATPFNFLNNNSMLLRGYTRVTGTGTGRGIEAQIAYDGGALATSGYQGVNQYVDPLNFQAINNPIGSSGSCFSDTTVGDGVSQDQGIAFQIMLQYVPTINGSGHNNKPFTTLFQCLGHNAWSQGMFSREQVAEPTTWSEIEFSFSGGTGTNTFAGSSVSKASLYYFTT